MSEHQERAADSTNNERTDWRAEWVERHLKKALTPFQRECVELICDAMRCGPYDFARTFERAIWNFGKGVRFIIRKDLSSHDSNGLTRLVIGAHDRFIRVEVDALAPRCLAVMMHPRYGREGCLGERHPTIEHAIAEYRKGREPVTDESPWRGLRG